MFESSNDIFFPSCINVKFCIFYTENCLILLRKHNITAPCLNLSAFPVEMNVELKAEQILLHFVSSLNARDIFFNVTLMSQLFSKVASHSIIDLSRNWILS